MVTKSYHVDFEISITGFNDEHCDDLAGYLEVDLEHLIKEYFKRYQQRDFIEMGMVSVEDQ